MLQTVEQVSYSGLGRLARVQRAMLFRHNMYVYVVVQRSHVTTSIYTVQPS